ncbi:hypothetical protein [Dactylosporangium sp. NPDC048998]|uniref:hypothetical protein n=1 Tax=Dactylosporangium sp. NPDC048998 TaxID=3363976 RepID=UPI0037122C74
MRRLLDEGALRVLMHADDRAPKSRVDLARVVFDGRRRRARRRGAVAGLAAAVAVLALTGATAVALRRGAPEHLPAGPPGPAVSAGASTAPARRSAGGFDPVLLLRIAPGWLPDGVRRVGEPTTWAAMQSAGYGDDRDAFHATEFTITLYAQGFMPRWLDPATAGDPNQLAVSTGAAPALGAGEARWYTVETHRKPGDPHARPDYNGLLWQWAPGSYATVEGEAPGTLADNRTLWRRIAERLGTAGRSPVPIGVTLTSVPAPLVLIGVDRVTSPSTGAVTTTLILSDRAYVPPPGHSGPGYRLLVAPGDRVPVRLDGPGPGGPPGPDLGPALVAAVTVIPDQNDWTIDPVR